MTLCITYATSSNRSVSISDSLLTTVRTKSENGSFLPPDQEIVHTNPYGVKIHIISGVSAYGGNRIDILSSVAGNVSLGLQCALHTEAYLRGCKIQWYGDIIYSLEQKIFDFWWLARDQSLQMSFALCDHKMRIHILECIAEESGSFSFSEVEMMNDIQLSVIGDDREVVKRDIFKKINTLSYSLNIDEAIHTACVESLKKNR